MLYLPYNVQRHPAVAAHCGGKLWGQVGKYGGKIMLTDKAIKNAKPRDKSYKLFDGMGMFLEVMPHGSKLWRLKYRYLGKETRISLGNYPHTTLADAREKRDEVKKQLQKDINPSVARDERRQEIVRNAANTFKVVALEWHEKKKGSGWSEDHADNTLRRMEVDIFPSLGARPIRSINAPTLLTVLKKIEERDALDIAGRVKSICGQVFRHGIQKGYCDTDPTPGLKGALKVRKTTHFASIEVNEIPALLHKLERNDKRLHSGTRNLITFLMHTFVRPSEAREAVWSEIDFAKGQWVIPAGRMKMKRDHIVPLSQQALGLLEAQRKETAHLNTPWVFPSPIRPKDPMSDGTVLVALKRMGYGGRMTAHGFRSLARTAIREELNYEPDIIEQQLAHKAAGPLGEAYDRARFISKRQKMMQEWSDYLEQAASKVVEGSFRKRA